MWGNLEWESLSIFLLVKEICHMWGVKFSDREGGSALGGWNFENALIKLS